METFTVYGSYGELTVDADTGMVLKYTPDGDWQKPGEGYEDIVRFDIPTWKAQHSEGCIVGWIVDILNIGFWTAGGKYEEPVSLED